MLETPLTSNARFVERQRSVLVVDDEASICDAVGTALRYEGFEVSEARSGRQALACVREQPPDLILLDVMLPDLDGFEVARRLRTEGLSVPVLFLTARDALDDKREGFGAGGDDYVTKPFSLAEIVLRVHAILHRTTSSDRTQSTRLQFADVVMDTATHEVWRASTAIELTATEFNLLRYFLLNPRRVLSKTQILDAVWHYDFDGNSNVLETYVSYLRKKLNALGPPLIHTIRLVGYALRSGPEDRPG